jgi:hypothetical protein
MAAFIGGCRDAQGPGAINFGRSTVDFVWGKTIMNYVAIIKT